MPTNANTFNSRVTSEALEAKYRQVFPAQGGAELVQDLFASGVIQPVVDFSSVAEGSVLAPNLQTAWDFSTGNQQTTNTTSTLITNTGFWKVRTVVLLIDTAGSATFDVSITDGLTSKPILKGNKGNQATNEFENLISAEFVAFLRAGDSLTQSSNSPGITMNTNWRQIADVNGNLVNPLGFTFS